MEKERLYNILSIACGIWFLLFGMFWTYWMNLVIAYPVGIAGMFFWYKAYKINKSTLNNIALSVLIIGLICSIGALLFYL